MWWHILLIPALGRQRQRQEDICESETSHGYMKRLYTHTISKLLINVDCKVPANAQHTTDSVMGSVTREGERLVSSTIK